jgi:hypothetical protein
MQLSIGELLGLLGAAFGLSTTIIVFLVKMLLSSYREKGKQDIKAGFDEIMSEAKLLRALVDQLGVDRDACQGRHDRDSEKLETQMEKLREKWEMFIKENAAMEATRGRKVEALFGVVDSVKTTIHSLPTVMHNKMDEMHRLSKDDLRSDLRKYTRELVKESKDEKKE